MRNKLLIATGAMLPDFLDKPIGALFFQTGRWFGHALLFQITFLAILLLVERGYKPYPQMKSDVFILYLGSLIHLLGDLPGLGREVAFWPFYGPFPVGNTEDFLLGLQSPFTVVTEVLGLLVVAILAYLENWDRRANLFAVTIFVLYSCAFLITYSILVGF
jgi:hypothetical protein